MGGRIWRWVVVLMVAGGVFSVSADAGDYRIGLGDVLEISVWKNPDLTRVVTVLPDGKISFPLISRVTVVNKTVDELSAELKEKLERFVPEVDLSIMVAQVNSMMIYVVGRVNHPGRFVMSTPMNVLQALATAGGLNPFANGGSIKIFREKGAPDTYIRFDFDEVAKGENLAQNILLQRGDVVLVP